MQTPRLSMHLEEREVMLWQPELPSTESRTEEQFGCKRAVSIGSRRSS